MTRAGRRLLVAQGADVLSFGVVAAMGVPIVGAEQNPLTLALYALGGVAGVALGKLGLACGAAWAHGRSRHQASPPVQLAILAAAISGMVGAGFNVAAVLWLLR